MKYQLVLLGPATDRYAGDLAPGLTKGFTDLGLDPAVDLELLTADAGGRVVGFEDEQPKELERLGIPVCLWFGEVDGTGNPPNPGGHQAVWNRLDALNAPVIPLVPSVEQFRAAIPPFLGAYNARAYTDDRLPADILDLFGLTREIRQAFISYRRTDSQAVADQLFEAFTHRGYQMFLDTASVDAAAKFQAVLMDRLADMDMVVFLDSPNVGSSKWVLEEFKRADMLNLGMLQLIWPDKRRLAGSEFADPLDLTAADFATYAAGPGDVLTPATLARVLQRAEAVRIKSLGLRRRLVVGELTKRAEQAGLMAVFERAGPVELKKGEKTVATVIPLLGLPNAMRIYHAERQLRRYWRGAGTFRVTDKIRVFYDGLGIQTDRAEHLVWLNGFLKLKTATFERERGTTADPLQRWLAELSPWWERILSRVVPTAGG
jgi:hypothetical protein